MIRACVHCPAVKAGGSTPSVMHDNCVPAASFLPRPRSLEWQADGRVRASQNS